MTTLFCSKKLEQFIGKVDQCLEPDCGNKFGNWNGHLFIFQGKKHLLFTNDQTSYSFVWGCVKKSEVKNFDMLFSESFIRQLDYDLKINERQEVEIRNSLADLRLAKANNNERVLGIMNEFVHIAKHFLLIMVDPGVFLIWS